MTDIQSREIHITLIGRERADGSVFIESPDLPMFTAVGKDEESALNVAMSILPEYLRRNVPDYVELELTSARSAYQALAGTERCLPAHIIATAKEYHVDGATTG